MTREFVIMPEFDRQWDEKDNLSKTERNAIAKMIAKLEQSLKKQEKKK